MVLNLAFLLALFISAYHVPEPFIIVFVAAVPFLVTMPWAYISDTKYFSGLYAHGWKPL